MKPTSKPAFAIVAAHAGVLLSGIARADELNMRPGVTEISQSVYDLHMLIFWICVVIGVVVFSLIFWSMFQHRKSRGVTPATFHESTRLEFAWTLAPVLILVGMAWPATEVLVQMYDTGGEDLTIEVRGYQWKWEYKYLDEDYNDTFGFFSNLATSRQEIANQAEKSENYLLEVDRPLRIPANRKVRFLITAEDVIHAWWLPDFGIKRDAIPGILNELWTIVPEPGVYRGQCTELCGKDHGFMPIVVEVLPEDEFDAWYRQTLAEHQQRRDMVASKSYSAEELLAEGEAVYETYCASCHQADGVGMPPAFPAIAGSPVVNGPVDGHLDVILNGRPGTAMQAFGKQLDAAQVAAVAHYQRHSFGNHTGDIIQPQDVLAFQGTAAREPVAAELEQGGD